MTSQCSMDSGRRDKCKVYWAAQTPSGIHPRDSAVPGLTSPLPSDVLLQVKVFGKGLVAVSAFQLGGLWFP